MIALIMAGGVGSRFWPLSKKEKPKQFLKILSEKSMLQMTVERLFPKFKIDDIYIVTAASQVELTKEHLPQLPPENIIVEPFGMNTAPCIALSALYLSQKYPKNEKMFVLPADHLIANVEEFHRTIEVGSNAANDENLVTFGIKPTYPATGYGYIESGNKVNKEVFEVNKFKEKPNYETAEKFLKNGNFFWNSGMFLWKLETILNAFANHQPQIFVLFSAIEKKWGIDASIEKEYHQMPRIPIDIGIMEKSEKRVVVPVDYGWSDVGSWKSLYDVSRKDENENVLKCNNATVDSKNNYVKSTKFVALIGVENLVVVETDDAILITSKDRAEEVKKITEQLDEL